MKTKQLLLSGSVILLAATGAYAQSLSIMGGTSTKKADNLHLYQTEAAGANAGVTGVRGGGECLTWVDPSPTTGWTDFNTEFGGAPCDDGNGCPFNEISAFEVWKSEAYRMDNVQAGTSYTFSHCDGPGAGSWTPDYTIIAPSGAVDAFGSGDGDGCSITWTASETGNYLIVINEEGNCGTAGTTNNGFPAITCNGTAPCPIEIDCEAGTVNVPASQCVEFGEATGTFGIEAGSDDIPEGGVYVVAFVPVQGSGTGGSDQGVTLIDVTLPIEFDNDLNGLLSANSLPPFAGQWRVIGAVLADAEDDEPCDVTTPVTVNFMDENSTCDVSAGVLDPSSFQVYPNPNNGIFTVSVTNIQGNATVEVLDLSGRVLRTGVMVMGAQSRMDFDLGGQASGLYLVRFTVDGASHVSKVSVN